MFVFLSINIFYDRIGIVDKDMSGVQVDSANMSGVWKHIKRDLSFINMILVHKDAKYS